MANERRYVLNGMLYENNKLCASKRATCTKYFTVIVWNHLVAKRLVKMQGSYGFLIPIELEIILWELVFKTIVAYHLQNTWSWFCSSLCFARYFAQVGDVAHNIFFIILIILRMDVWNL